MTIRKENDGTKDLTGWDLKHLIYLNKNNESNFSIFVETGILDCQILTGK